MARARSVSGLHPRATLLENARAIVAMRVAEMFSFAHAVGDPAQDEDLHTMRIAAKRLRYTLEMFRVCLGPDGPTLIDVVKEIQERIGAIHDADVLAEMARQRLVVASYRHLESLHAASLGEGNEEQRVAAMRAALAEDPRPGLALLMARTRARRDRDFDDLTAWWGEHGGDALRARLDACLLDAVPAATLGTAQDAAIPTG